MELYAIILTAVGVSMDAFGVAISKGMGARKNLNKALIVGLYFGLFQALMPVLGFLLAGQFNKYIEQFDHWIAFVLLSIIGGKMIFESFSKPKCKDRACPEVRCTDRTCPLEPNDSVAFRVMLPLAFATSVDAFATGITFAAVKADIVVAAISIGVITFSFSVLGVLLGSALGKKLKSKAELFGGIALVLIGLKILLNHLGVIPF